MIDRLAQHLDAAAMEIRTVPQLTIDQPDLSLDDAYAIQRAVVDCRIERGATRMGMKMGLTSLAKMAQVGVHEPIYGYLTSDMMLADGGTMVRTSYGHPRAEPEIAFLIGRDLQGTMTEAEALDAVIGVMPAIEVIDSRFSDFKFKLEDVVADNASSCRFVIGASATPLAELESRDLSLGNLGMILEVDGEVVQTGSSAAILEHPARSLTTLLKMLAERGEGLHPGDIVLAGAATPAVHLQPGQHVRVRVDGLGSAEMFVD
ncbi:MAG: fumarylacetoacetate hydrolase family protein [Myxococcales bacterium]|nr:fumarylacetoacetate hydrolase family protein [Myxococcales bacterium]